MSGIKATLIPLAIAFAILSQHVYGQDRVVNESYKKWLTCDVFWDFSDEEVGPEFSLKVSFRGTPVTGSRITLNKAINVSGDGIVATAKTDSRGIAHFRAIPKGSYYPDSAEGLLFRSRNQLIKVLIKVATEHAHREQVNVDWPSNALAVRNLRGRLSVSDEPSGPEIPLRKAIVELRDVYTARLIETGATDANGDYEFATTSPGVYALRLILPEKNGSGTDYRDLAIELNPAAEEISIPEMKIVLSDCPVERL